VVSERIGNRGTVDLPGKGDHMKCDQFACWMMAICCLVWVAGCTLSKVAAPTPAPVNPDVLMMQLTPAATLEQAAKQLAVALGTTVDVIRVRMTTGVCIPCSGVVESPVRAEPAGVPVNKVSLPLARGSLLWLSADDLTCFYYFDGEKLAPQSCRIMPTIEAEGRR
jgi:hypothetical protein